MKKNKINEFLRNLVYRLTKKRRQIIVKSPRFAFLAFYWAVVLGLFMLVFPQYFFLNDFIIRMLGLTLIVMSFPDWVEGKMVQYMWEDLKKEEVLHMHTDNIPVKDGHTYIGHGAKWEKEDLEATEKIRRYPSDWYRPQGETILGGYTYLHGVIRYRQEPIFIKNSKFKQHMMCYGASGCGKSVSIETLVTQAIRRGEPVMIIDPKGTDDMINRIYSECVKSGCAERFRLFAPIQYPDQSIKYSPLSDFSASTEPADRIGPLLGDDDDNFVKFCWGVVNTVVHGLIYVGETVNARNIERYALREPWTLVKKCLIQVNKLGLVPIDGLDEAKNAKDIEMLANRFKNKMSDAGDDLRNKVRPVLSCIELALKPGENYSKMVNNLLPFFSFMNDGKRGDLLNPAPGDSDVFSWDEMVEKNQVVYFALGSLISPGAAYSLGKLTIMDLLSYGGRTYAYVRSDKYKPVNLFIDELNNVVMNEFVDVVNKLRGANVRTVCFTQTMQDLTANLPSEDHAFQLMGSMGMHVQMKDETLKTSEFFSSKCGEVMVNTLSRGSSTSGGLDNTGDVDVDVFKATVTKSFKEEKKPLVDLDFTMHLPIGHGYLNGDGVYKIQFPLYQKPEYNYLEKIGVK